MPVGKQVSKPREPGCWNVTQRTTLAEESITEFWKDRSENSMVAALEQGPKKEVGKVTRGRWWGLDQSRSRRAGAKGYI